MVKIHALGEYRRDQKREYYNILICDRHHIIVTVGKLLALINHSICMVNSLDC